MSRRMIINALHPEECRIAITEDNRLSEIEIEVGSSKKLKGNIYKGRVTRIEPSLQAAFVDFGTDRNGFLQINDIHPDYSIATNSNRIRSRRSSDRESGASNNPRLSRNIRELLEPDQEVVVQVIKEERELKGSTLTTYLALPGRYLVLTLGNERAGVSRKIGDLEQRKRLKSLAQEFELPSGTGLIVRTAGLDRSQTELSRDLALQLKLWERIMRDSQLNKAPSILYKESELATRVVRDYFTPDIREIIVEEPATYTAVREFVGQVMPRYRSRVVLFDRPEPIFNHYQLDSQITQIFQREVKLPSGGAIIIESLEALVAIDVNSGRSTTEGSIEDTALKTNLEAAEEVARQLRLRDLGGLIVIDFIDMSESGHRTMVEKAMKQAIRDDKARIEIGKLSKFGLLEMSRQRLRASLLSQSYSNCSNCKGTGLTKNTDSTALEALRKIHAAVVAGGMVSLKVRLPPASALYLLNVKKRFIVELEEKYSTQIMIVADGRLKSEEFEFEVTTSKSNDELMRRALSARGTSNKGYELGSKPSGGHQLGSVASNLKHGSNRAPSGNRRTRSRRRSRRRTGSSTSTPSPAENS